MADQSKPGMDQIREAVRRRHGGFEQADDAAVLAIWNSLDESTRRKYLTPDKAPEKVSGNP